MAAGREQLRGTFNTAARLYQQARPEYPARLFDELLQLTDLRPGDRLLEIGCATGKATVPLAQRGFWITCIEIGAELAELARLNLARFPDVRIVNADFETWKPPRDAAFNLVFAATAWHWLDPAVRCRRAFELLRRGGHLALWSAVQVFPENGDPFFREIQDVYAEIGEGLPAAAAAAAWPRPGQLADDQAEIEASGLFDMAAVRHFDWEVIYTAEEYIRLLSTFSGHLTMAPWQQERLYGEIRRRLAGRPEPTLRRHWGAVLQVARRLD